MIIFMIDYLSYIRPARCSSPGRDSILKLISCTLLHIKEYWRYT